MRIDSNGPAGQTLRARLCILAACIGACMTLSAGAGARQAPPAQTPAPGPDQPRAIPAPVVLGMRADMVRMKLKVSPTVVIVQSPDDYALMIASWSLGERFPVLIDDGTNRAREDIARFVRAFAPQTVVRWAPKEKATLPSGAADRAQTFDTVWRSAWGARTPEELGDIWKQTEFESPGVVVASASDPAWTAAVALAAGRGQSIIWTSPKAASPTDVMPAPDVMSLDAAIRAGIEALNPPGGWRGLGDQIDSVTLCMSVGARIPSAEGELALTDHIGRHGDGSRYAWCGMIFGNEARAAYMAMCALFLEPSSAWVFDGYKPEFAPPYHLDKAVELLDKLGMRVSTNLAPRTSIDDWRDRSRFGTNADFIHVNSSGLARFFDLNPGRGYPADVPPLGRPAAVHFIHSFSAQHVGEVDTVGGRWLENGAYAYLGSMNEPFLSAFLPAHAVVARLFSRAPWGAAVRADGAKPWKLNVFGDPLITFGPPAPRLEAPLTLEGALSLEDEMRQALKARKFAAGAAALIMLGRDKDVVRIAQAAFNPDAGAMNSDLARIALTAAFREREADLFLRLYYAMGEVDQRDTLNADMLWRVARPMLATANAELVTLLRETVRPLSMADDASALASSISRLYGADAVKPFFAGLAARAADAKTKQDLIELGNKF
jgi:hypothetical protein